MSSLLIVSSSAASVRRAGAIQRDRGLTGMDILASNH